MELLALREVSAAQSGATWNLEFGTLTFDFGLFRPAQSRTNAVEKLREKRGGAKAAEKRRVKRVIANAPFGERILKSNSPRLSAFSAFVSSQFNCMGSVNSVSRTDDTYRRFLLVAQGVILYYYCMIQ